MNQAYLPDLLEELPSFGVTIARVEEFFAPFSSKAKAGLALLSRLQKDLEVNGMPFGPPVVYSIQVTPEFFKQDRISLDAMLYSALATRDYPVEAVTVTRDHTLNNLLLVEFTFGPQL